MVVEYIPLDSPMFWLLAVTGIALTGISKSGFAGGAGVVAVPLLALVIPIPVAVALMLPLLIVMDVKTISYYRNHVDRNEIKAIIPAAIIGIALGGLLMGLLPTIFVQIALGILAILFALWQMLAPMLGQMRGSAYLWGAISGITSTLIHAGGPPINIYLVSRNLPKLSWLATAGIFFGVMNLVKIIPYTLIGLWTKELLMLSILLMPVAFIGVSLGKRIQKRISEAGFNAVCRFLLFSSGLMLLIRVWLSG